VTTEQTAAVCQDALSIYRALRDRLAQLDPACDEAKSVGAQLHDARVGLLTRCAACAGEVEAPPIEDEAAFQGYVQALEAAVAG